MGLKPIFELFSKHFLNVQLLKLVAQPNNPLLHNKKNCTHHPLSVRMLSLYGPTTHAQKLEKK